MTETLTGKQVLALANKAGFHTQGVIVRTIHSNGSWVSVNGELERFYTLARADLEAENAKLKAVLSDMEAHFRGYADTDGYTKRLFKAARAALGEPK